MQKYPKLHVEISGHADSQGTYRHNMDRSRRRAESVKRYMVDQGVKDERLSTRGVGPNEPIDTNETDAGRARNRRIEFRILDEKERRRAKGAKPQCD
jgi:outer membrane protein OmpA-like peptidoglycan-associated protein